MERVLSSFAVVTAGFHYRTRVPDAGPAGEWRVAQGREADAEGSWAVDAMPRVNPGPAERRARLVPGDVLVLARGERPYACVVPDWPWPALASSSFYRVRLRPGPVLPEYLSWYLNTPGVVATLAQAMRGAGSAKIRFLPRAVVQSLVVPTPTLARQAEIAGAAALVSEEARLHAELTALRRLALAHRYGAGAPGGAMLVRREHIALVESQLAVVRDRLARGFAAVGLGA